MKNGRLIIIVVMLLALTALSFIDDSEHISNRADKEVVKMRVDTSATKTKKIKKATKSFDEYRESIAWSESRGNYKVVNKYGYLGKYQFGKAALKDLGLNNVSRVEFLNNEDLQERAFIGLLSINKYRLRKYIDYVGSTINGIKVT